MAVRKMATLWLALLTSLPVAQGCGDAPTVPASDGSTTAGRVGPAGPAMAKGGRPGRPGRPGDTGKPAAPAPGAASVTVTPGTATLAVGGATQLAATFRDSAGATLSGPSATWTSSHPGVATVSATGLVTGVAGGTATITATGEGVSGTAAVTVTQPAVPVNGAHPAPDLASHDFDDGTLGSYAYPWKGTSNPENLRVVSDPTGAGKAKLVQVDFLGSAAGQDRNRALFYSRSSNPYGVGSAPLFFRTDLYLGAFAPGTDGRGDQRKLTYWKDEASGYTCYTLLVMWGRSLRAEVGYVVDGRLVARQASNLATLQSGRWYTLEVQLTPNSAAAASDGVLRIWLNGAQVLDWTDVRFFPTASHRYRGFGLGYQLQTATATGNESRYFDRVAYSTRRIGS